MPFQSQILGFNNMFYNFRGIPLSFCCINIAYMPNRIILCHQTIQISIKTILPICNHESVLGNQNVLAELYVYSSNQKKNKLEGRLFKVVIPIMLRVTFCILYETQFTISMKYNRFHCISFLPRISNSYLPTQVKYFDHVVCITSNIK